MVVPCTGPPGAANLLQTHPRGRTSRPGCRACARPALAWPGLLPSYAQADKAVVPGWRRLMRSCPNTWPAGCLVSLHTPSLQGHCPRRRQRLQPVCPHLALCWQRCQVSCLQIPGLLHASGACKAILDPKTPQLALWWRTLGMQAATHARRLSLTCCDGPALARCRQSCHHVLQVCSLVSCLLKRHRLVGVELPWIGICCSDSS